MTNDRLTNGSTIGISLHWSLAPGHWSFCCRFLLGCLGRRSPRRLTLLGKLQQLAARGFDARLLLDGLPQVAVDLVAHGDRRIDRWISALAIGANRNQIFVISGKSRLILSSTSIAGQWACEANLRERMICPSNRPRTVSLTGSLVSSPS